MGGKVSVAYGKFRFSIEFMSANPQDSDKIRAFVIENGMEGLQYFAQNEKQIEDLLNAKGHPIPSDEDDLQDWLNSLSEDTASQIVKIIESKA